MKMTSRDKELVTLALSLGIVAISWFGGAEFINQKTEEVNAKKEALQNEFDERTRVLEKKEDYIKDTKSYNDAFTMMLDRYPGGIAQERQIDFVVGLEKRFHTQVLSVDYTDPAEVYAFQSIEPENSTPYRLIAADLSIPVTLPYSDWKDLLDYVFTYEDKSTIPEISARFDGATGNVQATVQMRQYAISGEDRTSDKPEVLVPIGTDNIFASSAALSYDGGELEQKEAIKKKFDCYMMLYPPASDVAAKVIAAADESEKVVSKSNEIETLSITAQSQADGTASLTYTLGAGKPGVIYNCSGDTIDIYVLSTFRSGKSDLSGVQVKIDNQTTKKMRIAVSGDDEAQPRFVVTDQSGEVEILK